MAEDGENSGKKAAQLAAKGLKLAGKTIFKAAGLALAKLFGIITLVTIAVVLIIFLFIGAILGNDAAQAADVGGQCSAGNAYSAQKGYGPNPTIVNIMYQVLQKMNADNTVQIATYETALQESGIRNLANSKIPESYAVGQDGKPKYPWDPYQPGNPYGSDGMSVGVFQQQVGYGWAPGSTDQQLTKLMDPAYATQQFVERAMKAEKTTPGVDPGALAIKVQAPLNPSPAPYDAHSAQAQGYITQAKSGTAGAGTGTSASGVVCSSVGTLVPVCTTTGPTSKCTVTITSHGDLYKQTQGAKFIISLPVKPDGTVSEAGNAVKAAVTEVDAGQWYLWGGGSASGPTIGTCGVAKQCSGFDCSGLMIYAVAKGTNGRIVLPHYTTTQENSPMVTTVASPAPGDLVFSEEGEQAAGEPGHVTMYIGKFKQQPGTNTWVSDPNGTGMVAEAAATGHELDISPLADSQKLMPHPYSHPNYK